MGTLGIVLLIILAVLIVIIGVLYFLGRKAEKKQAESQKQMEAAAQSMSFYIIDKKKMALKDANLPKIVLESTPKYLRRAKMPILKVKVGPKIMNLVCDVKVYETLLPKMEVKASVSGIYVNSARRIRGPVYEPPKSKKEAKRLKKEAKKAEKAKAKNKNK
jgi:hypothetical protein